MKRNIEFLSNEINQLKDVLARRSTDNSRVVYEVGKHRIPLSASSLTESAIFGILDIAGFSHLLEKVLLINGSSLFKSNVSYNELDDITKEKISDLLGLFYL